MSDPTHAIVEVRERAAPVQRMHPMVEAAIAHNPDPATLRELLAVQREWEAGEARKAYDRAMVLLKRDLPAVIEHDAVVDFTGKGGHVHYTHSTLARVIEDVTPALTAHGFSLTWRAATPERGAVRVTAVLSHEAGHCERMELDAPIDGSGGKNAIQGVASSTTYLARYAVTALLGIATRGGPTEPTGEPDPATVVDLARNQRAAARLAREGHDVATVEAHLGRAMGAWTVADMDRIAAWVAAQTSRAEPGQEG